MSGEGPNGMAESDAWMDDTMVVEAEIIGGDPCQNFVCSHGRIWWWIYQLELVKRTNFC